jgi:hypothetical protein
LEVRSADVFENLQTKLRMMDKDKYYGSEAWIKEVLRLRTYFTESDIFHTYIFRFDPTINTYLDDDLKLRLLLDCFDIHLPGTSVWSPDALSSFESIVNIIKKSFSYARFGCLSIKQEDLKNIINSVVAYHKQIKTEEEQEEDLSTVPSSSSPSTRGNQQGPKRKKVKI